MVKFFPVDPGHLREELTRYSTYLSVCCMILLKNHYSPFIREWASSLLWKAWLWVTLGNDDLERRRAWPVLKVLIFQRAGTSGRRREDVLEVVASMGAHLGVMTLTAATECLPSLHMCFNQRAAWQHKCNAN